MADIIELSSGSDDEDTSVNYANRRQFQEIWKIAVNVIPIQLTNANQHNFPYNHIKKTLSDVAQKLILIADQKLKDFVFTKLIQLFQAFKFAYHGIGEEEKMNFLLLDFVALYINFKCDEYYTSNQLKLVINKILTELHVLFSGKLNCILMIFLKVKFSTVCAQVVRPIFKKCLSDRKLHNTNNLVCYIRLILFTRKWNFIANYMVNEKQAKYEDVIAKRILTHEVETILPAQVPAADELNRSFIRISDLIGFAIRKGHDGTRILLENDSLNINETIERFFRQYEVLINKGDAVRLERSDLCLNNIQNTHSNIVKEWKWQLSTINKWSQVSSINKMDNIYNGEIIFELETLNLKVIGYVMWLNKSTPFDHPKRSCSKQLRFSIDNDMKKPEISYLLNSRNIASVEIMDKLSMRNDSKELMNQSDLTKVNEDVNRIDKVTNNCKNNLSEGAMCMHTQAGIGLLTPPNFRIGYGDLNSDDKDFIANCQNKIERNVDIVERQSMCVDGNINDLINLHAVHYDRADHQQFKNYSLANVDKISFYRYDKFAFSYNPIKNKYVSMQNEAKSSNNLKAVNQSIIPLHLNRNIKKKVNSFKTNVFPSFFDSFFPGKINNSKLSIINLQIREYNFRHNTCNLPNIDLRKFKFANMFSTFTFPSKIVQFVSNVCLQSGYTFVKPIMLFDNQSVDNTNNLKKNWIKNEKHNFGIAIKIEIESNDSNRESIKKSPLNSDQIKSKTIMSILRHNFKKPSINKSLRDCQPLRSELGNTTNILRKIPDLRTSHMKLLFSDTCNENAFTLSDFVCNKKIPTECRQAIAIQAGIDKPRHNEVSSTSSVKRKCEAKSSCSESIDKKRKKIPSEGNSRQNKVEFQHSWHNEEILLKECLSNLKLEKLYKETEVLLKSLMSLSKSPTLEAYFIINKIIVTFIYECLLSLDYSRITLRKYLSICSKAKKLQAKNVDNAHLYEIELKYQELKVNIHNPSITYNLDLVLNSLRNVKKHLFSDEWLQKNKNKIQKYVYMDPIELTLNVGIGCVDNDETLEGNTKGILRETLPNKSVLNYEQKSTDSYVASNIQKIKVVTSRTPRNKCEDGFHCTDVNLCDFVEYDSKLGSSNLDFMPGEIKSDGPIIPFPQNSGDFNDILLSEADISSLNDSDTTDHFFSNQSLDSNILVDTEILCAKNTQGKKTNLICNLDSVKQSYPAIETLDSDETNLSNKGVINPYIIQNERNLLTNSFWKNVLNGPDGHTIE